MKKWVIFSISLLGYFQLHAQSSAPVYQGINTASNQPNLGLKAYPNPVKDILHTNLVGDHEYHIYSIEGKVIRSGIFNKNINLNQIPKGLHTIVVQLYPGTWTIRISKED